MTEFQHQRINVPTGVVNVVDGKVEASYENRLITTVEELKQAYADIKNFQIEHGAYKFSNATKILKDKFGGESKVANSDLPDVKEHKRNQPHTKPKAFMGPNYVPDDARDNHHDRKK
jgi:hypothetical protein